MYVGTNYFCAIYLQNFGSGPAHMTGAVLSAEDVSFYNFCLLGPITSVQTACETLVLALRL